MAELHTARRWATQLGRLTSARMSSDEAADFVEAVAPMLAMRFADTAFSAASLEHVAAQCKYLPTYGEIVPLLRDWWRAHGPKPQALPAPEPIRQRDEPTAEEREHVARVTAETIAALRSSVQPVEERRPMARCLSREQLSQVYERAGIRGPMP